MEIQTVIKKYTEKYSKTSDNFSALSEIAINALSLTEAWRLNCRINGSLTLATYDDDDAVIDQMHGADWDSIPVEIMNICINQSNKVKKVRVFAYINDGGKPQSNLVGELEIS